MYNRCNWCSTGVIAVEQVWLVYDCWCDVQWSTSTWSCPRSRHPAAAVLQHRVHIWFDARDEESQVRNEVCTKVSLVWTVEGLRGFWLRKHRQKCGLEAGTLTLLRSTGWHVFAVYNSASFSILKRALHWNIRDIWIINPPKMQTRFYFLHLLITLCAKLSGTVYCNWSCLWICLFVGVFVGLLPR